MNLPGPSKGIRRAVIMCLLVLCVVAQKATAYVFITNPPPVWPAGEIKMDLQLPGPGYTLLDGNTSWKAVATNAFSILNAYIGHVRFAAYPQNQGPAGDHDGTNQVFFDSTVYGTAFDDSVLALTSRWRIGTKTTEADTIFNSTKAWDSYRGPLRKTQSGGTLNDFRRVALHEFGHNLGLDHPDQHGQTVNAIMNTRASDIDSLTVDDIQGIQALYSGMAVPVPTIEVQPQDKKVPLGTAVSFSVVASGAAPLTFQWRHDGKDLTKGTAASLTLSNTVAGDAGAYTVAIANPGGSVTSAAATLSFSIKPARGTYTGLFYETNGISPNRSGSFTLVTAANGVFSTELQSGTARYSGTGLFNSDGDAQFSVKGRNSAVLNLTLQTDYSDPDWIRGTVAGPGWTAALGGFRAPFNKLSNPAPNPGLYTMVFSSATNSENSPHGASFGTVTTGASGSIRLVATLADGTKLIQVARRSQNGDWPLYVPLYRGRGSLISWIAFAERLAQDFGGALIWTKSAVSSKYYATGFQQDFEVTGSRYSPPVAGQKILNLTDATLFFEVAKDGVSFTNVFTLDSHNKAIGSKGDRLKLSFTQASGLFTGNELIPGTAETIVFRGAVLQKANAGAGFFLKSGQSGRVLLSE